MKQIIETIDQLGIDAAVVIGILVKNHVHLHGEKALQMLSTTP